MDRRAKVARYFGVVATIDRAAFTRLGTLWACRWPSPLQATS